MNQQSCARHTSPHGGPFPYPFQIFRVKNNFRRGLFRSVLGGQGQVAVIAEVRIHLEPIPLSFSSYTILHNDFE
jgi:hypothetical protein